MLGYDVSFAFIHAITLAQQGSGLEKKSGSDNISLIAVDFSFSTSKCRISEKIFSCCILLSGYVLCTLLLKKESELSLLLINTIQKVDRFVSSE